MKKLLALIMALMMMFSLAACNNAVKTDDKKDDDKSTVEDKDDNKTSEDEEDEDVVEDEDEDEDEDEKKTSKKDDVADVIEGTWVTSIDMAEVFNMGLASAGDDVAEEIGIDEFIVNMYFEFDGDEVTYYMEADDIDAVKDELKENVENADMDLELDEDQLDTIFDTMVEGLTETEETGEFELDGDTLIIDGEEFGDVTVKNNDKIVVELADETAEAFESMGFDSSLTFERD